MNTERKEIQQKFEVMIPIEYLAGYKGKLKINNKKNILFIYLGKRQHGYFGRLGNILTDEYNVHYLRLRETIKLKDIFKNVSRLQRLTISDADLEELIKYYVSLRKYSKKLSLRRRFLMNSYLLKKHALSIADIVSNYMRVHSIDLVCMWNGARMPLAVTGYIAKLMGIRTLYFENGVLPNTTTIDSKGVNFCNSLVDLPLAFWESVTIDRAKLQLLTAQSLKVREKRKNKSKFTTFSSLLNRQEMCNQVSLPENYIFVPFQVHDDTQVLLFSPRITTMEQLLKYVCHAVEQFNQKVTVPPLKIVVKEHPSDYGRVDYTELRQQYHECNVVFANDYLTEDLIKQSKGVITLNSSVGIEALLYHKPVITLGNAFYNIPGLVTKVTDPNKLPEYLYVIDQPVNFDLINKFLYYLRYTYLTEGSWRNSDEQHFARVKEQILNQLGV